MLTRWRRLFSSGHSSHCKSRWEGTPSSLSFPPATVLIGDAHAATLHSALPRRIPGFPWLTDARWALPLDLDDLTKSPDLRERRRKFPHEISDGQQQRCAIGRALANIPLARSTSLVARHRGKPRRTRSYCNAFAKKRSLARLESRKTELYCDIPARRRGLAQLESRITGRYCS